ncbi:CinA family protein [Streptomyces sp. NPDC048172]|uniref:CinA family protein n=1 Tax=Streptomyces sp. NPDC048172 TaxID=3365505 RepID=UPI0037232B8E
MSPHGGRAGLDGAGQVDEAVRALGLLRERGETLAIAESLTGGLVAAGVTAVAGASRAFRGSVTAYATELKRDVLGVDGTLLAERGAVDPEVARQMARGVRRVLGADWGIATTGVAGPEPQDGQPVGTVYVAVAGPDGSVAAARLPLEVDPEGNPDRVRARIRTESVRGVLELLCKLLIENAGDRVGNRPGGMDVCSPE